MSQITLYPGDNRQSLRRLIKKGVRVHAVACDPPYGLVSVQKRFGKEGSAPARTDRNDGSFARLSGGFMGRTWDATGIERDPEFWKLVYDILLPGGYVFAFSGSRTGHWQACAMELAGFIMHPMHGWCYATGFPKAHAADKAIDKLLGVEGGFLADGAPVKRMIPGADQHKQGWEKNNGREYQPGQYVPGSPEAEEWEGWAYGTQAQKPALEPIYLGQKPFSERTGAANLLKHGVGAVNIDGCRVPSEGGRAREGEISQDRRYTERGATNFAAKPGPRGGDPMGRHPANLILDGSPEVVTMFTGQGAESASRFFHRFPRYACETCEDATRSVGYEYVDQIPVAESPCPDCGGLSGRRPDADPLFYHPKAGKLDRAGSKHPTVKPIALMQYLIRHITPKGGTVLDPFAGSGTTGEAALREGFDCILMEAEPEYIEFLERRFEIVPNQTVKRSAIIDLLGLSSGARNHPEEEYIFDELL